MKTAKSVALLAGGKLTDSPLARFWSLSEMLGPVQASSYRLASRIANRLRAGYPVQNFDGFNACRTILISVPDSWLPRVLAELCSAEISWPEKAVVLCSSDLDSSELREFSARRAAVGSITTIPGFEEVRYLVEGDKLAVRESRRLVEHGARRAVVIERGLKPSYLAALTCTGSLLFAPLLAASEALRHAGVTRPASAVILEKLISRSLRAYLRAGRRAYQAPRQLSGQLHALSLADPPLASYVEQSCRLAARLFEAR
ncbi:MAG TPA: hypothetical protein VEV17_18045 [Bryobacteraceae bacterium]|nr:hypothetical protein [Bryobacteraceae bacterium]